MKTTQLQSTSQLTREIVASISQAKAELAEHVQAHEATFDAGTASPQVLAERVELLAIVDGLHRVLARHGV